MTRSFTILMLGLLLIGRAVSAQTAKSIVSEATVSGTGFTVQTLRDGETAFGNRRYVWVSIPAALQGWQYTQTEGGQAAAVTATPAQPGFVYAASAAALPGWEPLLKFTLHYTDKNKTALTVYRREAPAGQSITIPQNGWSGTLLLALHLEQKADLDQPAQTIPVPPGVVVDFSPAATRAYIGSPSLVILPNGDYLASHDLFGPGTTFSKTRLFVSHDKGLTWAHQADISGAFWSTLFVHAGQAYLFGTNREFGDLVIRRSGDGGRTWTTPADAASGLLGSGGQYACGPGAVVVHSGRVWRAMEHLMPGVKGRHFLAFVLSAPLTADLLQASSWAFSRPLDFRPDWAGDNWLEGNAVETPQNTLVNVLRTGLPHGDRAAIVHVSEDGSGASFDPASDLTDFPGGNTKFTIRYDPISRCYWSLVNPQKNPPAQRNILALTSSPDLRHWTIASVILQNPDTKKTAFQYVDWQFDGSDIVAVSRTAYGGAHTYHDANFLTFHRIPNFRSLLAGSQDKTPK